MSDPGYARLAWALFAVVVAVTLAGMALWSAGMELFVFFMVVAIPFAVVGVIVASRRPRNAVGWLFLIFGLIAAITATSDRYATYAIKAHPGSLPAPDWVAWISTGIWHPAFGFFVFSFLLFPDGRLPSRRWRPVAYFAGVVYVFGAILGLLWGPLFGDFFPYIEPPFQLPYYPVAETAFLVFLACNFALLFLSMISLVLRLRRSSGVERQQLKWFVYAVAVFAVVFPLSVVYIGDGQLLVFLLPLVPVAAGIGILRHRLFDIDVVINKTLVYGSLTASLVAVYLAGVISLEYLVRVVTGGESQLAIVASTLVVAALFVPLRRRIQRFIDRRFYRSKYDAAKILDAFSKRLRDETDLDELGVDLISVAHQTVHPAHVSLWLKPGAREKI